MKHSLAKRLNYLHTRLHEDFGDTDAQTVWLDDGGGTWTKIPALQTRTRPVSKDLVGVLGMEIGEVVIFVKKSDWPALRLEAYFHLGPPSAGDANIPHADNLKYRVTACPASPQIDWQRIEAQQH